MNAVEEKRLTISDNDQMHVLHETRFMLWLLGLTPRQIVTVEGVALYAIQRSINKALGQLSTIERIRSRAEHRFARLGEQLSDVALKAVADVMTSSNLNHWCARLTAVEEVYKAVNLEGLKTSYLDSSVK